MSSTSYWTKFAQERLTRRRTLGAAIGVGFSAVALATIGCGEGDGDGEPTDSSGLVNRPQKTQGKPGGVLKHYSNSDTSSFEVTAESGGLSMSLSAEPFYPRLITFNPDDGDPDLLGEVAERWEVSGDNLEITFKIRQGMLWDRRAPTNGRPIDAQDVVFSWNRFTALNSAATRLKYDANLAPDAPIESMTAIDASTLKVRLHQPYADVLPLLGTRGNLFLMPREADGGFDPKTTVRGHGPWLLDNYEPSVGFTWVKNPDFYLKNRPFPDKVEVPIVPDQAQRLAQFRAGAIYTDIFAGAQQDVLQTKKDLPQTLLMEATSFAPTISPVTTFGWRGNVPWRDERVRQALSMMIDREAWVDVASDRDRFAREGIEVPFLINSALTGGYGDDFYIDPLKSEFGPSAKYLKLDIQEATRLLSAAGHSGLEFDLLQGPRNQYGAAYNNTVELYDVMFRAAGLRPKITEITPGPSWQENYGRAYRPPNTAKAKADGLWPNNYGFEGVAVIATNTFPTVGTHLFGHYNRSGGSYRGMTNQQNGDVSEGDSRINELTTKLIGEFDKERQISLARDIAKYAAEKCYYIVAPAALKTYGMWWPVLGNIGAYPGRVLGTGIQWREEWLNLWIDETKAPIART